jgi:hypothetical protein
VGLICNDDDVITVGKEGVFFSAHFREEFLNGSKYDST